MKILYAEDERQLSVAVAEILKMEGYEVDGVYDGKTAWERIQSGYYDAVILDVMMPEMDGIEVLAQMRGHKIYTPVLMLTAKATVSDRVEGLSVGADDYLGKPFSMKELTARLSSMIRRNVEYKDRTLQCGNVTLDCVTGELKSDKGSLRLSGKESALLALFMKREGDLFTVEEIREVLQSGQRDESAARLYVSYLRNKLGQLQADLTIDQDGTGYRLTEGEAS